MRRAVWLIVVVIAAASTPQALADDGVTDVSIPSVSVPDATELAAAILEEAGTAVPTALDPALPELTAAPAQTAAVEPAPTGAVAAPPPEPASEPSPDTPPQDPPPTPAQADPPVVQQEPTNVNVSVRVDSPGDDGAVSQVNVAVAEAPAQYQAQPVQYQPAVSPAADPMPSERGEEADDGREWSWTWSCGDASVEDLAIPSEVASLDWNWNWNWNCGHGGSSENNTADASPSRYQPSAIQYRPVNINISIRINSAGNNGPVVQTNVAVGVTVPALALAPVSALAPFSTPAFAPEVAPGAAGPADTALATSAIVMAALAGDVVEELDDCCLLAKGRGGAFPDEASLSVVLSQGAVAAAPDITADTSDTVAAVARFELRARHAASAAAAPPRPQARPARPVSTRGSADEPAVVTSGFGLAPIAGPDRTLPWVLLVAAAFLFASANTSWASTRSRPTPGADADDPPNPPG